MPEFHVAKAVRSNPIFGRHLRWIERFPQVLQALGCGTRPESAVAFAECVSRWQATHGLKDDGMLGPKTWAKLKKHLRADAPAVSVPDWLKLSPEAEGWIDAIVSTLRQDTKFIQLTHGIHSIRHRDFLDIAGLVEIGHLEVVPLAPGEPLTNSGTPSPMRIRSSRRAATARRGVASRPF